MTKKELEHISEVLDFITDAIDANGEPRLHRVEVSNEMCEIAQKLGIPLCGVALHMVGDVPMGKYVYLDKTTITNNN